MKLFYQDSTIDSVHDLLEPDVFVVMNIDLYLDLEVQLFFSTILAKQLRILCISSGLYGLQDIV